MYLQPLLVALIAQLSQGICCVSQHSLNVEKIPGELDRAVEGHQD